MADRSSDRKNHIHLTQDTRLGIGCVGRYEAIPEFAVGLLESELGVNIGGNRGKPDTRRRKSGSENG